SRSSALSVIGGVARPWRIGVLLSTRRTPARATLFHESRTQDTSVLSRKIVKQVVRLERSLYRRENTDAHRPTDSPADPHAGRARDTGALGAPREDRAGRGPARAADPGMCRRPDQHGGRARAAADQADRRQVAPPLPGAAPRGAAG